MKILLYTFSILIFSLSASSHGDEERKTEVKVDLSAIKLTVEKYKQINAEYVQKVKPIFVRSCFDCHSDKTVYPWYHKIPGVKQFLDKHIQKGREHLNLSNDFPFIGHKNRVRPERDLKEIVEVIKQGEMPLFSYKLIHRNTALSDEEIKIISEWAEKSIQLLK